MVAVNLCAGIARRVMPTISRGVIIIMLGQLAERNAEQSKKKRRTEEMVEALDEDAEEAEEARRKRKWANGAGAEEEKAKRERAASAKSFCGRSGAAAAMTVEKVAESR